jgi:hypothetical protein
MAQRPWKAIQKNSRRLFRRPQVHTRHIHAQRYHSLPLRPPLPKTALLKSTGPRVRALLTVILLGWAPKGGLVSNYLCGSLFMLTLIGFLETLKAHWWSPIYTFFKPEVEFQYFKNRPCHLFTCLAPKCKTRIGGIHRFQDSKDKSSTANLKHHALRCFGAAAVNAAIAGKKPVERNKSIFALFARKGKQPVKYLHHVHTNPEVW